MLLLRILPFCALLFSSSNAYKMVLFVPNIANSQVIFSSRVAETLARAGHDVTMVMISALDGAESKFVKIMEEVKVHYVNASVGLDRKEFLAEQEEFMFQDLPMWDRRMRESMNRMFSLFIGSCRKVLENKEFHDWLAGEKFDLAFSYVFNLCPIGLIYRAKIPAWIWLNSAALMDVVAHYMGVPRIPSYVPPIIMESTDHMNFLERTKSLAGHTLTIPVWKWILADKETALFRELLDPKFPDLIELAEQCPLVMVNSNDLYDIPRPTLAKIVNIGGVGMQLKDVKPLAKEFQRIVDRAEGIVVFSFGSVTPSEKMPGSWKLAFIDAFKRFPNYHFIWRYVGTDLQGELPPNVHVFKWLPQSDLLQNPKIKAFITHGGYNSVQESISAGVPLITIPLFGDQPKNALLAERHRFAVTIHKSDLSADVIAKALDTILTDHSFSRNVERLSRMVRKQPVSAAHLIVSWAEFVAEFRTLDNLVPAGTKLNFIQYHSLDVITFLLSAFAFVLFVIYKLLKFIILKLCFVIYRKRKQKNE